MAENLYESADEIEATYDKEIMSDVMSEAQHYVKVDPAQSSTEAKVMQDQLENVSLNIAITGESGVGKSSFVNALRGLSDGDDGSAETGVTETTIKTIRYSHPTMPNVYIWDLPGIGTPNFKAKKYLKEVKFDTYDFFLIIGSVRFKENDILLAKEIKKMKKTFYFVRSKIDQDVQSETRKNNVSEEQVLSKIRLSCRENLMAVGSPTKVFLITTLDLGKYDFQKLVDSLQDNLSDHKWSALLQALPVCSLSMIDKKRRQLQKSARAVAAAGASTVMVPIPGLTVGCEIGIMVKFLEKAWVSFGLDEKSILALAERVNKPQSELKSVMKSRFSEGVNHEVVTKMLRTTGMVVAKTIEALLFGVPILTLGISFGTTLHILSQGIKEMAEDAKAVIVAAGL